VGKGKGRESHAFEFCQLESLAVPLTSDSNR